LKEEIYPTEMPVETTETSEEETSSAEVEETPGEINKERGKEKARKTLNNHQAIS
jgi:hypothetical protein